ncbi:VOC family protein [Paenibacillus radicis (ex Xue et al. 2023)]|uniref:VOC family protein n=1 Tax=Paenibacillus radicis (ex Xue et al. 2023) TaxID=2972489 RepID=A0ABT1YIN8_9BACL|nr:VOC family protein [Paenibacillus radicis (ex Xue et al. 2023)]MCR8633040.1 VOC family protein [Paenibacillus radicis (ex Xue et al. 2023)]
MGTDIVAQIAVLVNDIETTSQAYADFFGIEKPQWKLTDTLDKTQATYNGEPAEARAKLAFIKFGNITIELIEPDHNPSTWREVLDEKGEGFHHIAFRVDGLKSIVGEMEDRQMPLIQKGEYTGGRYAYMDTFKDLKLIIELLGNDIKP